MEAHQERDHTIQNKLRSKRRDSDFCSITAFPCSVFPSFFRFPVCLRCQIQRYCLSVFYGNFMKPQVEIYDTTLRDGSQGEGINFSVADKLRIAEKLDAFGVHYIEGGWPGSNPKDIEFFAQAKKKKFKNAKLAAFGSTRKKGVAVEQDDQVRLLK